MWDRKSRRKYKFVTKLCAEVASGAASWFRNQKREARQSIFMLRLSVIVAAATGCSALLNAPLPTRSSDSAQTSRRAALASGAAVLVASRSADALEAGGGLGQTGALRSDIGESVKGSGVEILVTDLKYNGASALASASTCASCAF